MANESNAPVEVAPFLLAARHRQQSQKVGHNQVPACYSSANKSCAQRDGRLTLHVANAYSHAFTRSCSREYSLVIDN